MNVCVFCGSNQGGNNIYQSTARSLGASLAYSGHTLVYGGGAIGLMGILAESVMQNNGSVIGVIPDFLLKREVALNSITRLEVVGSMHERKKRMADLSDIFVAIPGGWGTLDELAEILTWRQLRLISNRIFILNINNFFNPLLDQMNLMVCEGFLSRENLDSLEVVGTPAELISQLSQ